MENSLNILETKRLALQRWTRDDADALFEILRDPLVARYLADGRPFTFEKVEEFLIWAETYERENGFCRWKVVEKASCKIIGSCGFARPHCTSEIELGYLLAQTHWGKGLATEIAESTLDYGFKRLGFDEVIALTDPKNIASKKVLAKIGFIERGLEIFDGQENLVFICEKSFQT